MRKVKKNLVFLFFYDMMWPMRYLKLIFVLMMAAFFSGGVWAAECDCLPDESESFSQDCGHEITFKQRLKQTAQAHNLILYFPVLTWHNRFTYDHEKTDSYNEKPWGFGLGNYFIDERGNQHGFYAMGFSDSHKNFEPFVGYAWQANWYLSREHNILFGLGYTLGITAREDYHYIPFPAILPIATVEFGKLGIQATYIPGTKNNGNVLFSWLTWKW